MFLPTVDFCNSKRDSSYIQSHALIKNLNIIYKKLEFFISFFITIHQVVKKKTKHIQLHSGISVMVYLLSMLLQQKSSWAFPSSATFCTKSFSSTWLQPQNIPELIWFELPIPECWNSLKTLSLYKVTKTFFDFP